MKIVGIKHTSFTPRDSDTKISGSTFYITEAFASGKGEGVSTDHFFLSADKLSRLDFAPSVGDVIQVLYNRYGKVETICKADGQDELDF